MKIKVEVLSYRVTTIKRIKCVLSDSFMERRNGASLEALQQKFRRDLTYGASKSIAAPELVYANLNLNFGPCLSSAKT
jgi:hypothetical protein